MNLDSSHRMRRLGRRLSSIRNRILTKTPSRPTEPGSHFPSEGESGSSRGHALGVIVLLLGLGSFLLQDPARGQDKRSDPQVRDYTADCTSAGCHSQFLEKSSVHDPVASGDCDCCHEAVEGEGAGEHEFTLLLDKASICIECHDDIRDGLEYVHGPVAANACVVCHDPHATNHEALLLSPPRDLCFRCHESMKEKMTTAPFLHDPAIEDCLDCHSGHGGKNRMILQMDIPALCLDCHDEIGDVLKEAVVDHGAMKSDRACSACHDPHASQTEYILQSSPMELCMSCHEHPVGEGQDQIAGLGDLLKNNPNHHGPIREKDCTSCHSDIHGGAHFRLLIDVYPPEFYAPFEEGLYALCFRCHEPDLVQIASTTALTGFRNGDQNLHFLHVNRTPKGRTCRSCHSTHASCNPLHIAETVPFGQWEMPISFMKTDTGGSCSPGCHIVYAYDRVDAVINAK